MRRNGRSGDFSMSRICRSRLSLRSVNNCAALFSSSRRIAWVTGVSSAIQCYAPFVLLRRPKAAHAKATFGLRPEFGPDEACVGTSNEPTKGTLSRRPPPTPVYRFLGVPKSGLNLEFAHANAIHASSGANYCSGYRRVVRCLRIAANSPKARLGSSMPHVAGSGTGRTYAAFRTACTSASIDCVR